MLPMAMHRKQKHPKQKQKSSATSRSGRPSLEHSIPEEGLKPDPYSLSSSTINDNVPDMESGAEIKKSSCAAVTISSSRTSQVGIPSRNLSVAVSNLPTNIIQAKKSVDMRPLSVLPPAIKRSRSAQRRCYLILGIATIVVCVIAFTIWLTYDSLQEFVSSLMN